MASKRGRFAAVLILCLACKESAWTPMGSAEVVLAEIKTGGAPAVARRIDADENFGESVMNGIATGDSAWIEVARQIEPASSTAEASVVIALASALPAAPKRVLSLLARKYPVDEVCGIPFIEIDSARITRYRDSAAVALASVRDSTLLQLRDRCSRALDEAKEIKLARIDPAYLIKNKPAAPARRRRRR